MNHRISTLIIMQFALIPFILLACVPASPIQAASSHSPQESFSNSDLENESEDQERDREADEEDEEGFADVSAAEVISFAKKQLPEFVEIVDELRGELEEDEVNEFIVEQGRELIGGFREIKEIHGRRLSQKFLELFMVNLRLDRMLEELEVNDLNGDELAKAKQDLKQMISKRFTLQLAMEKAELNHLKAEVEDFELEINRRVENRDNIIGEELQELLSEFGLESDKENTDRESKDITSKKKSDLTEVRSIEVTEADALAAGLLDYQSKILPLFRKACFECHRRDNNEGELDLQTLLTDLPLVKNRRRWINVYEQTRNHVMPPESADRPSTSDRRTMVAWIHNQIHQFDYSKTNDPGFEPIRRLTHREYSNTIRDLFLIDFEILENFPADLSATSGFDNSANSLFLQPLLMEKYLQLSEKIAEKVVSLKKTQTDSKSNYLKFLPAGPISAERAFEKNLEQFLPRAFRRPVGPKELASYQKIFQRSFEHHQDFFKASQVTLQAILTSPKFLFRLETQTDESGAYRISQAEYANRLSYFLWTSLPDEELVRIADSKGLFVDKNIQSQTLRMLNDPRAAALGDVFASQWLGFQHLGTRIRADPIDNPWCTDSLMEAMKQETSMFIVSLIRENRSIRDLLTADHTFVNDELARFYKLEGVKGKSFQRITSPAQRGGLLGHASILAVTSHPYQTSPVKRGTWVLTEILGTPPPPPPPGASEFDERLEENDRLNFRQKLARHSNDSRCSTCHRQIDPLGFGLESFDWFGRYRRRKVDNSGQLPDGTRFRGINELSKVLAEKKLDDIAGNFVRRILSYALSRQLEYYDEKTVEDILAKTRPNHYPMRDIVLEVVRSYPFQFKKPRNASQ